MSYSCKSKIVIALLKKKYYNKNIIFIIYQPPHINYYNFEEKQQTLKN